MQGFQSGVGGMLSGEGRYHSGRCGHSGQEGARRVATLLHDAGVRTVKVWSPQQGFKDAREQYNPEEPCALVNDILRNCKPI